MSPKQNDSFQEDKCSGGKHSKVRLMGMAAGNAKGERLSMFVIRKSKNSRCFKGLKEFLVVTKLNKKVGCRPRCLKSELKDSIEILVPKRGKSP